MISDSFIGDVVYIKVTGQPTVILGSVQAANELLDTRGMVRVKSLLVLHSLLLCVRFDILR